MVCGAEAVKIVRNGLKLLLDFKGFGKVLEKVSITSAGDGHCEAEFTVNEDMVNIAGSLHGGCAATIIDVVSTLGLLTTGSGAPGVSVNLSVNYLKGIKLGQKVILESRAVKVGKTLAFLDVKIKNKETGDIMVTSSHIKHLGG